METVSNSEIFSTRLGTFEVSPILDAKMASRFKRGEYNQEDHISLLERFIKPDSVVLDVGAHIGTMTIPFARVAAQVHAFEPMPSTREFLVRNIAHNQLSNVIVHPVALGQAAAEAYVHVESGSDAGKNTVLSEPQAGDTKILISTLDSEVTSADVIKIDAEGMECEALTGGERVVRAYKPVIFCEVNYGPLWNHGTSPAALGDILRAYGYDIYIVLPGERLGWLGNWSLGLATGLQQVRYFLGMPKNYPFDIIAIHKERQAPPESMVPWRTLLTLFKNQLIAKISVAGKSLSRILPKGQPQA
jgi:FkbM family methyltransferase